MVKKKTYPLTLTWKILACTSWQVSEILTPLQRERQIRKYSIGLNTGLYLRVCIEKLIFFFLDQNICCGYTKEPSQ